MTYCYICFFTSQQPNWYHFSCFWKRAKVTNSEDVGGLDSLRWEDQEKVKEKISGKLCRIENSLVLWNSDNTGGPSFFLSEQKIVQLTNFIYENWKNDVRIISHLNPQKLVRRPSGWYPACEWLCLCLYPWSLLFPDHRYNVKSLRPVNLELLHTYYLLINYCLGLLCI